MERAVKADKGEHNIMNKIFKKTPSKWLLDYYDTISNICSAVFSIICSLFANWVYESFKTNTSNKTDIFIICVVIVIVVIAIVAFSFFSRWLKNKYVVVDSRYKDYIEKAYLKIQELSFESQAVLQEEMTSVEADCLLNWSIKGLEKAIDKCYDFFIASFGKANEFIETISFEVTFMTKSYKDNELTIACFANNEKKQPTSMLKRKVDKLHYKGTVAADLYKQYSENNHPNMVIISDTTNPIPGTDGKKEYEELYKGQRKISKSSIVVPVLSRKDELLGVMVVYCNQTNFFLEDDRQFWEAMTNLFTIEIGSYKFILDILSKEGKKPF